MFVLEHNRSGARTDIQGRMGPEKQYIPKVV